MKLRPYQQDGIRACVQSYREGDTSGLLVLPTGAGKTIVFSSLIARSRGAIVYCINLPESEIKIGLDDFFAQNYSVDDLMGLKTAEIPDLPKQGQVERLMAIAESYMSLLYANTGEYLAAVTYADNHREVLTIGERGSSARNWLLRKYGEEYNGSIPSTTALSQVMEALGAYCESDGQRIDVFARVAGHGGAVYLDMGISRDSTAIEIDANGWRIVKQPPVYFKRAPGMLPLPMPQPNGTLDDLPKLFGLDPKSPEAMSINAWLLGTLHPTGPYTVLNLRGEQGALKTTWTEILKCVIDPNIARTRQPPTNEEDVVIAASKGHVIAFDNLSSMSLLVSDMLSKLATGFGYGRRTLYRDSDETMFYLRRPVVFNGIPEIVTKGDLLDRLIPVALPSPKGAQRKERDEAWNAFTERHPFILGALLDAASAAIRNRKSVDLGAETPRMADFMVWVEAAVEALGWKPKAFLNLHRQQQDAAAMVEIESSSLALTLLAHLEAPHGRRKPGIGVDLKDSDGREIPGVKAVDLFRELKDLHTDYDKKRPDKDFPGNSNALTQQLSRLIPAFRKIGWEITNPRDYKKGRFWRIEKVETDPMPDGNPDGPDGVDPCHDGVDLQTLSCNNPLNSDNLSEDMASHDGADGVFPYSLCLTKNEKREKSLSGRDSDPRIKDTAKTPSAPSAPSAGDDDTITEYFC